MEQRPRRDEEVNIIVKNGHYNDEWIVVAQIINVSLRCANLQDYNSKYVILASESGVSRGRWEENPVR